MASPVMEMMFEIWNDGWHIEVGQDRDGLGMIEIRYYEGDSSKALDRMSFSKDEAALVRNALTKLLENQ